LELEIERIKDEVKKKPWFDWQDVKDWGLDLWARCFTSTLDGNGHDPEHVYPPPSPAEKTVGEQLIKHLDENMVELSLYKHLMGSNRASASGGCATHKLASEFDVFKTVDFSGVGEEKGKDESWLRNVTHATLDHFPALARKFIRYCSGTCVFAEAYQSFLLMVCAWASLDMDEAVTVGLLSWGCTNVYRQLKAWAFVLEARNNRTHNEEKALLIAIINRHLDDGKKIEGRAVCMNGITKEILEGPVIEIEQGDDGFKLICMAVANLMMSGYMQLLKLMSQAAKSGLTEAEIQNYWDFESNSGRYYRAAVYAMMAMIDKRDGTTQGTGMANKCAFKITRGLDAKIMEEFPQISWPGHGPLMLPSKEASNMKGYFEPRSVDPSMKDSEPKMKLWKAMESHVRQCGSRYTELLHVGAPKSNNSVAALVKSPDYDAKWEVVQKILALGADQLKNGYVFSLINTTDGDLAYKVCKEGAEAIERQEAKGFPFGRGTFDRNTLALASKANAEKKAGGVNTPGTVRFKEKKADVSKARKEYCEKNNIGRGATKTPVWIKEFHPDGTPSNSEGFASLLQGQHTEAEAEDEDEHERSPYRCEQCRKGFSGLSGLWYHNKTRHKEDMDRPEGRPEGRPEWLYFRSVSDVKKIGLTPKNVTVALASPYVGPVSWKGGGPVARVIVPGQDRAIAVSKNRRLYYHIERAD